ncbi:hypothetical protein GPECTOR_4g868 [Gonium pectorale]|uniref:Uncharacterized protein n=1 Tax=Gonium pectorale TaxID=33097 RepID=A0A150GY22_GONPE|nr:hypothetical protein GPECTOR_4g868 [Gonium pectorale]|eukprot:KXZ54797.1 hypothetical protein GPECTOR_4g868 [Gonium pectorale]
MTDWIPLDEKELLREDDEGKAYQDANSPQDLQVLYLYDNQITVIEGLSYLRRLTHLYLANNAITAISGLDGLPNLQKLYLEHNSIQVISGLEAVPSLEELHVSSQRLPPGASLTFDPPSVAALGASLRVLTASSCGLTAPAVRGLAGLRRLRRLDLSHNALRAEEGAFEALDAAAGPSAAPLLANLDLRGNPLCRGPKYRDTIILMNDSLTTIDDEA